MNRISLNKCVVAATNARAAAAAYRPRSAAPDDAAPRIAGSACDSRLSAGPVVASRPGKSPSQHASSQAGSSPRGEQVHARYVLQAYQKFKIL